MSSRNEVDPSKQNQNDVIQVLAQTQQQLSQVQQQMAQTQQQFCEYMLKQTQDRPQPVPDIFAFRKLNPVEFKGTETALESDDWLKGTEARLKAAKIPQADWLEIVQLQLLEPAISWWISETSHSTDPMSWTDFTTRFLEKYVPVEAKRHLQEQYIQLKQGTMTVNEYDDRYNVLGRFAPQHVRTQKDHASRYVDGLRQPIRPLLSSHCLETQREIRNIARDIEDDLKEVENHPIPDDEIQCLPLSLPAPPVPMSLQNHLVVPQPRPVRMICNFCKQLGHIRKDCPSKKCRVCKKQGHFPSQCPIAGQTSHSPPPLQSPRPRKIPRGGRLCYQCRRPGHVAADCPESLMTQERQEFNLPSGTDTTNQYSTGNS